MSKVEVNNLEQLGWALSISCVNTNQKVDELGKAEQYFAICSELTCSQVLAAIKSRPLLRF